MRPEDQVKEPPPPPPPPPGGPPPADVVREQDKLMLVFSYLSLLALVPLLTVNDSDYVRWHAKNGLVLTLGGAVTLTVLGRVQFAEAKYDEALDTLSRAAKLDPQNPDIENYLGVTLAQKGLRAQAETALRRAVQLDPNYGAAHNNLAVIYLTQQPPMVELARWHYEKALAAGQPHNPALEKMLADKGAPVSQ